MKSLLLAIAVLLAAIFGWQWLMPVTDPDAPARRLQDECVSALGYEARGECQRRHPLPSTIASCKARAAYIAKHGDYLQGSVVDKLVREWECPKEAPQ